MRISPWTKVWLLGFWLGGLAGFVRADTVIVIELMDSEQLVGVPGEVALASDDSGGLVSRHAKSDASGQVEFRSLTVGTWHLTSKVEDYASEHATIDVIAEDSTYRKTLYLKKGKRINGRITDSEGKPISRAQVSVYYARDAGSDPVPVMYQWESGDVITDRQGVFEIRNVHPEKELVVEASHEDFLPSISPPTTVGDKSGLSVDLSLGTGFLVTGTLQADDGTPVVGAKVGLLGALPREARRFLAIESLKEHRAFTASDENGAFRFEQVRPGEKLLLVSHPSYNEAHQYFDLPKSGRDTPISVTLQP